MNIVGLGTAGCNVAMAFENMPQYKVFCIGAKDRGYRKFIKLEPQESHEDYEAKYKKINTRLISKDPTTVIVSGGSKTSGAVLRLLEQLKSRQLTVLYVKPDLSTAAKDTIMMEKVVFGVLQQYARSKKIFHMIVVDNSAVELIIGNISVSSYWEEINNVISNTYHMINVFTNTEPLLNTLVEQGKTSNICTLGVVATEPLSERSFYDLKMPRTKKYFFGISEKSLNEKKDLLPNIRAYLKKVSTEECSAGFAIYSTQYEADYAYSLHYASMIQEENV
jgi:hypothetical protein